MINSYKYKRNKKHAPFTIKVILFMQIAMIAIQCKGLVEVNKPIQFNDYIIGDKRYLTEIEIKLGLIPKRQNYFAKTEWASYIKDKIEKWEQKEWFKRPNKLRREIIKAGEIHPIFINDGKRSWNYFPGDKEVFRDELGYKPTFYIFKMSKGEFEKYVKTNTNYETDDEIIIEEEFIKNGYKTISKIWINKTTLLPSKWEDRTTSPDSILLRTRRCVEIQYDVSISNDLFRIEKDRVIID